MSNANGTSISLQGKVVAVFNKEQITDKFAKQEFVIETDGQYPETFKIQAVNDKIEKLSNLKIGQFVELGINLRGKKFTKNDRDMYFTTLDMWKIDVVDSETGEISRGRGGVVDAEVVNENEGDGLPF